MDRVQVLVVGAGPAGYTAAIYAARAGLKTTLFTGPCVGGQLTQTAEIENFPGFPEGISGADLMERMGQQVERLGVAIKFESIKDIDVSHRPFESKGDKTVITADAIIMATGATAKWLGVKGEEEYKGAGVSTCATCDGFFYKGKSVAVVGGGNTATVDALFLAKYARDVTLIHRKNALRAEQILQERIFSEPKIKIMWNTQVTEVCGNDGVLTHVNIYDTLTQSAGAVCIDGLFVAVGHVPQVIRVVDVDDAGYVKTRPGTTQTSIPGIFAAGDVMERQHKQAVVAAGRGCQAALEAAHFVTLERPQSLKYQVVGR
jgi:thioredoxin reductase (NADPH)